LDAPLVQHERCGRFAEDSRLESTRDATPAEHKGTARRVLCSIPHDPSRCLTLVIGDVGEIAVDKHDHIWVYHRPPSISPSDSGIQGVAGADVPSPSELQGELNLSRIRRCCSK
jgi:hypothetical protein